MPKTKEVIATIPFKLIFGHEMEFEEIKQILNERFSKGIACLEMHLDRELMDWGIPAIAQALDRKLSISMPGSEEKDDNDDDDWKGVVYYRDPPTIDD